MSRPQIVPSLLLGLGLFASLGCSTQLPPRPVPPPEAQPTLPAWYPQASWSEGEASTRVFFHGKVVFSTGKAKLRPASEKVLKQLLEYLQNNPDISRVRLEGHTDSRAGEEYNQGLSERRAIAVADWLVDHGLDHARLLAVAFGESRPRSTNDTRTGRQENRRAQFRIAEVSGRRFRGSDPTNGGMVLTVLSKEERDAMARKAKAPPPYVPPPTKVERDIFKPYAPRKNKPKLEDEILTGDRAPTIDARTGKPVPKNGTPKK